MLQWFLSFPEFAEFTEIQRYLGKTQVVYILLQQNTLDTINKRI